MHEELRIHLLWLNGVGVEYLKSSWFEKKTLQNLPFRRFFFQQPTHSIWRAEKEKKTSKGYFKVNGRRLLCMMIMMRVYIFRVWPLQVLQKTLLLLLLAVGATGGAIILKYNAITMTHDNIMAQRNKNKSSNPARAKTPSKLVAN